MMNYEFKEHDAYDLARQINIEVRRRGHNLDFRKCPFCGGNKKDQYTFSIDLSTGTYNCLRAKCGEKGNFIQLAKQFGYNIDFENYKDGYYVSKKKYRTFNKKEIKPHDKAVEYMLSRGISEETTRKYEITVQKEHENVLVFPFFNEKSELQFIKYRKSDFIKGKDKCKEWCEPNCRPILFGMKQCNDKFDRLITCEGQIDSMSVASAGIENAVSVPTGALGFTWVDNCWDWVIKFKEIVVFGDFENGHMTLLDEIKQRFKCIIKYVREEDYRGCKDANEILQKHGPEAVRQAVDNAVDIPVEHLIFGEDVKKIDLGSIEKCSTGNYALDRVLSGGLPFGQVHVLSGKRGDGKSTDASQMLCYALDQGYVCTAYSGEIPNYNFMALLDIQLAGPHNVIKETNDFGDVSYIVPQSIKKKISDWYARRMILYDNSAVDCTENILDTITKSIERYNSRVILIDNLMTAIDLYYDKEVNKYDKQSSFTKKLAQIARAKNVLFILVVHKRKNGMTSDENDEVSGAAEITNTAGVVMNYNRCTDKERNVPEDARILTVTKNRDTGKLDYEGQVLHYDESSRRIYSTTDELFHKFGWEQEEISFNPFKYVKDDESTPFD